MARLTKSDIETRLLLGASVPWQDTNKKANELELSDAKQRRLFLFLLTSKVRKPTELPPDFVTGLTTAFDASDDPATGAKAATLANTASGPWRLQSIETLGFGGLNTWNGSKFHFDFDQESLLLEGANGCGKSSLIGAILWALMGERPRDQTETEATEPQPIYSKSNKPAGEWPPVACYPPSIAELKSPPSVSVKLVLKNPTGVTAKVERILNGGVVTTSIDPDFNVPQVIMEAGLLMPARLARLRLDDGGGRLTDAVQKLTGLDDLIEIGALVEGLCHKSREYRGYKSKELAAHKREFDHAIEQARIILEPVQIAVPSFVPSNTDDKNGAMAELGKMLSERASELAQVISSDLANTLKLSSTQTQNQVIAAIAAAGNDLKEGLQGIEIWKTLEVISKALDGEASASLTAAIASARSASTEAVVLLKKSAEDSKFQLKAVAAQWHANHASGAIEGCPLCGQDLKSQPSLIEELEMLRAAGDAAAKTFDDNINAIKKELESALPIGVRKIGPEILKIEPNEKLTFDIRANFVLKDRYASCLVKFSTLVDEALKSAPISVLGAPALVAGEDVLKDIDEQIAVAEQLIAFAAWFNKNSPEWLFWWQQLATGEAVDESIGNESESASPPKMERLVEHLSRLSDALAKSEPFRKAAEAMRTAWKEGLAAAAIEREVAKRDAIADAMMPLKLLGPLCEAVARAAIEDLSGRISALLERILLTEQLQFRGTQLDRKEGLVVRGGFAPDLHIDATLVANTSWLRAVLWCFLFALREEAVEQLGNDPFPVMIFDDPQATFDVFHRAKWAHYVAALQAGPAKLQIIIATYEEAFLDLIKADGITGRQTFLAAPGPGCDHVAILEGAALDRAWVKTQTEKTPQAAVEYLNKVRVHIEGMLKIMLRGEDTSVPKMLLGDLRELLRVMHGKAKTPWDRPVFKPLLAALEKGRPEMKYIEGAHHTTGQSYGMGEAELVEKLLRETISPTLNRAFKTAREYRLLHGGMKALYAIPPTASLPEGYQTKVRGIPLKLLGRAAALSGGKAADGMVAMDHFATDAHVAVVLGAHFAYRLTARTLEPVARVGDILLVKEHGEPSPKSLVVALTDEKILARRLEIAENVTDVAVLTAQTINPREIAPPVIAHKSTLKLHKITGILFDRTSWTTSAKAESEVCDCGGEAHITRLTTDAMGLVEVVGQSAEPHALDGQYLIVRSPVASEEALRALDGNPVIASDKDNNFYFKRLRLSVGDQVVLESLDSGGDYPPVLLTRLGAASDSLKDVWPVVGVLFEKPN